MPIASATAAKSGFCSPVAKGNWPAAFISSSTKFSEELLNTITFAGRFIWTRVSRSPSSIASPPSPDSVTACRVRSWASTPIA